VRFFVVANIVNRSYRSYTWIISQGVVDYMPPFGRLISSPWLVISPMFVDSTTVSSVVKLSTWLLHVCMVHIVVLYIYIHIDIHRYVDL
jgi:hypothetical protein